jgi:hypothetical protein
MPDDINKRMNYFDRQFLRAADFKVEQDYHLKRHRLHNKLLHTPGVAGENDFKVTGEPGTNALIVAAGIAIDQDGREIVLSQQQHERIPPQTQPGTYELTVRLEEGESDPSSDPGVKGATRIKEQPTFELLAPNMVKPPMLRLATVEVDPVGTLKSPPTSIRAFAGTSIGASSTFESVTANTFTLKKTGVEIAKRPDLSSNTSGDILLRTTRPASSSPEESLRITSAGFLKSPMWNVFALFENARPAGDISPNKEIFPTAQKFQTGGGTLLVFASGSGALTQATTNDIVIGMELRLDDNNPPHLAQSKKVTIRVKSQDPQPFVATFLVLPNIAPGTHNLTLRTLEKTTVGVNDCFNVTILELPF